MGKTFRLAEPTIGDRVYVKRLALLAKRASL
jgi:hypothetical protein